MVDLETTGINLGQPTLWLNGLKVVNKGLQANIHPRA